MGHGGGRLSVAVLPLVSLCTGGSGLDRGVALAISPSRVRPVLLVEREAFAAAYLAGEMEAGRMAPAPVWSDLTTIPEDVLDGLRRVADERPVALCGGFPCQPWSSAGSRGGTSDDRWLWPAIAGILRVARPGLVVLENVPGVARGGLGHVLGDLASLGYDVAWSCCRASDVGAPHRRERLFIVAVAERWRDELRSQLLPDADGERVRIESERGERRPPERRDAEPGYVGEGMVYADGMRGGEGEQSAPAGGSDAHLAESSMGDADREGREGAERNHGPRPVARSCSVANAGRCRRGADERGECSREPDAGRCGCDMAHADGEGSGRERWAERDDHGEDARGHVTDGRHNGIPRYPPGPQDLDAWRALLDERPWLAPALGREAEAEAERALRLVAHGLVAGERRDMLRLAGNGVVPQQAAMAIRALLDAVLSAEVPS